MDPVVPPLSPRRKEQRGAQRSPASHHRGLHTWGLGYLKGLQRPALSKVSSHENRASSNNQTLDFILQNSGFQINYLESKITRKPHSLLNLNIKDSTVSFESQIRSHFGTGSGDCFSTFLRKEKTTVACGPASAGPILSFLPASMIIISRCAMNHDSEGAPPQTHG